MDAQKKRQLIGLDLGGTAIKFGRLTPDGAVLSSDSEPTRNDSGRDGILAQLAEIAERLIKEARADGAIVEHVGVITPGAVDIATGAVIGGAPNIPEWIGAEIGAALAQRLGVRVCVENDARGMALAEFTYGAARGADSAICLTVGTGIGGGVIIDGRLWRGHSHTAGEIGHIIVDVNTPPGGETRSDTLEGLTATPALVREVRRRLLAEGVSPAFNDILGDRSLESLTARDIFAARAAGDPIAAQELDRIGALLGRGLVGPVNLLNPQRVILGGGVIDAVPELVQLVQRVILRDALPSATGDLLVAPAALGNRAGFIGAAALGERPPWR